MYVGRDFDVANSGESEVFAFNFVNDMLPTDSVVAATWALTVSEGTDANPSSRLDGAPFFLSRTISTQRISGLLAGVTYIVTCTVSTAQSNTITLWSRIPCEVIS